MININNIEINNMKAIDFNKDKNDKDKNDRFKDFDDILILEDTKDKKRKNSMEIKLISMEKYAKIPKPKEKKRSIDLNAEEIIKDKNLHIIEEVMEKEEKNKNIILENKEENKINSNNEYKNINKDNNKDISTKKEKRTIII